MSILWIVLGLVLLIPAVLMVLQGVLWGVFWLLSSNAIEYLIWPAILATTGAGVWAVLHGVHVL